MSSHLDVDDRIGDLIVREFPLLGVFGLGEAAFDVDIPIPQVVLSTFTTTRTSVASVANSGGTLMIDRRCAMSPAYEPACCDLTRPIPRTTRRAVDLAVASAPTTDMVAVQMGRYGPVLGTGRGVRGSRRDAAGRPAECQERDSPSPRPRQQRLDGHAANRFSVTVPCGGRCLTPAGSCVGSADVGNLWRR